MTATTGTDATGPVEYYFDETSGNPGGTDSGWQTSPSYTDSGLTANTQYSYTVQMRDSAATPNVGTASSAANATTDSSSGQERIVGDVAGGWGVGIDDLLAVCGAWLTADDKCDVWPVGGDGWVDFADFTVVAEQWGD